MLKLVPGQKNKKEREKERFLPFSLQFQFYLSKCCSLKFHPFFEILLGNLSAAYYKTQLEGKRVGGSLEDQVQEGLRLSLSRGLGHSGSLGDTHLAMVLELHPASIPESLWGRGRTVRLEDHSREDCKKAESLGQSIQVPSFQTTSHFLPHAHDHLFHVYIQISLFFPEIFRKKILYHRSANFIFFPNACYSMLKFCFIF